MQLPENIRRLFLAVDAPNNASEFIELNSPIFYQHTIKWMRIKNLHLTVYFIGNTEANKYDEIFNLSKEIISNYSNFTIYPDKICLMPSIHPRMIWIKYKIHPLFTELNHTLHHALKKFKLQSNQFYKEPIPHITLARFSRLKEEIKISQFRDIAPEPIQIKEVKLWETISSNTSSDYNKSKNVIILK